MNLMAKLIINLKVTINHTYISYINENLLLFLFLIHFFFSLELKKHTYSLILYKNKLTFKIIYLYIFMNLCLYTINLL